MRKNGFTLIELMITLAVIAVMAAIAYPSYTSYTEKKELAVAKQTALQLASELERFKNRNFSYKGFTATYLYSTYNSVTGIMYLPLGASEQKALYKLSVKDLSSKLVLTSANTTVVGQNWGISVERMSTTGGLKQPKNYDLLLTSTGVKCMTKTANIVKELTSCGANHADW